MNDTDIFVLRKKTIPFTQVPNNIILDKDLTAQAKGVALYLFFRPDGWFFNALEISKHFKNGRDSIKSALVDLESKGYLQRNPIRNQEGKFSGYEYILSHNTDDGKSVNGKSDDGKSDTNNTIYNNKERNIYNTSSIAEEIYNLYPRKVSKKMALIAINKALKKYDAEFIKNKTMMYAELSSWKSKEYIPHPSTWFNQERFNDNPEEWKQPTQGFKNKNQISEEGKQTLETINNKSNRVKSNLEDDIF